MKTVHRWLELILCAAMLMLLASCANTPFLATRYIPNDSSAGIGSIKWARNVLVTSLKGNKNTTDVRITSNSVSITNSGRKFVVVRMLSELPEISAHSRRIWLAGRDSELFYIYGGDSDMKRTANALYILKRNAIKQKKEVEEFDSRFAASLADYRKMAAANATLPEEANKYKVQAEGAVRDKEFDDAADFYAKALKIAPWWPAGHFNRALVLGEAGDYEMARREMNYYLQLVPGAPNARAAQDKIYEWERQESKAK